MQYWTTIKLLNQLCGELGLPQRQTAFGTGAEDQDAVQYSQLIAALNSAGNELNMYYPWAQFRAEFHVDTLQGVGSYPLPSGWKYFMNQTAWDRTNHWPLLGPKSAAEWAWLKGGLIASFPRIRYRVMNNMFEIWPIPDSAGTQYSLSLEYMDGNWVQDTDSTDGRPNKDMTTRDGDILWYDPWMLGKYAKLKWLQLKGLDSGPAQAEFLRVFEALKGKDVGAPVLSLVPIQTPFFIGPYSVPDGSWNV